MGSSTDLEVRLRPLRLADEAAARQAHAELAAEGFDFLLRFDPEEDWPTFVARLAAHRRGDDLPIGWVPTTFLVATVGLVVLRALGVEDVLVTCDDDNLGSATVIERCGGVLDSIVDVGDAGVGLRRYWIR